MTLSGNDLLALQFLSMNKQENHFSKITRGAKALLKSQQGPP